MLTTPLITIAYWRKVCAFLRPNWINEMQTQPNADHRLIRELELGNLSTAIFPFLLLLRFLLANNQICPFKRNIYPVAYIGPDQTHVSIHRKLCVRKSWWPQILTWTLVWCVRAYSVLYFDCGGELANSFKHTIVYPGRKKKKKSYSRWLFEFVFDVNIRAIVRVRSKYMEFLRKLEMNKKPQSHFVGLLLGKIILLFMN